MHGRILEMDGAGRTVWDYPNVSRGIIAGAVRDPDGVPIAGAQVHIYGADAYSDTTGATGAYVLHNIPAAAPRRRFDTLFDTPCATLYEMARC